MAKEAQAAQDIVLLCESWDLLGALHIGQGILRLQGPPRTVWGFRSLCRLPRLLGGLPDRSGRGVVPQ